MSQSAPPPAGPASNPPAPSLLAPEFPTAFRVRGGRGIRSRSVLLSSPLGGRGARLPAAVCDRYCRGCGLPRRRPLPASHAVRHPGVPGGHRPGTSRSGASVAPGRRALSTTPGMMRDGRFVPCSLVGSPVARSLVGSPVARSLVGSPVARGLVGSPVARGLVGSRCSAMQAERRGSGSTDEGRSNSDRPSRDPEGLLDEVRPAVRYGFGGLLRRAVCFPSSQRPAVGGGCQGPAPIV